MAQWQPCFWILLNHTHWVLLGPELAGSWSQGPIVAEEGFAGGSQGCHLEVGLMWLVIGFPWVPMGSHGFPWVPIQSWTPGSKLRPLRLLDALCGLRFGVRRSIFVTPIDILDMTVCTGLSGLRLKDPNSAHLGSCSGVTPSSWNMTTTCHGFWSSIKPHN